MLRTLTLTALIAAIAVAVHAQTIPGLGMDQAEAMRLQTEMMKAQAAAMRRGDEALSCDALQNELVATMKDPAIEAYAAKTNAAYAKELAARQKKGDMTAEYAAALAASLVPDLAMGGMPQFAPGQPISTQQIQQAMVAQQQAAVAYMKQLIPLMPALMRSQRVVQLAALKNCAWMTGGVGLYPGGVPGTVPGTIPAR